MTISIEPVWTTEDLLSSLERREKFFVLDVRNRDEFERFRLEGREPLPALNVPYFEMLELGGQDEMVDSVVACVEQHFGGQIPRDLPVLSVCAKGDTSEFVRQGLERLGYSGAHLKGGMKAWGQHYSTGVVIETPELAVYQVWRPARGCLSYMVASGGKALVIDPLRHLNPYLELAGEKGFKIECVIDTHGHADHISGGTALAAESDAPYHLHPYDAIHPMDVLPATIPYNAIRDGQIFKVGRVELAAIHIPGHTLGLVALRLGDRYLFTGDSICIGSISRPDLGGKADAWAPLHGRSLRKLVALPGKIIVLPGHFSSLAEQNDSGLFAAPLGELKQSNPGLQLLERESEEGFVRYLLEHLPPFLPEYVDIKRVNAGLLSPSEDEASQLELGKNVCGLANAGICKGETE
ncbi:MAG TPA: MBL fold metallo-hydrolase [Terriglobia bacterium]|nr:MBL fold metallo-hydrolase [Terriglobia bacterium]